METTCKCGATIDWKGAGTYTCNWCGRVWQVTIKEPEPDIQAAIDNARVHLSYMRTKEFRDFSDCASTGCGEAIENLIRVAKAWQELRGRMVRREHTAIVREMALLLGE